MGWKDKADDELKKPRKGGSWKLKEGENEIRVLPTKLKKKDKEPAVYHVNNIHTNVGPEKRVVTCGKDANGNGDDWLCDKQIPKDAESDSKSKRKRAETMKPKEVFTLQIGYMEGKKMRGPEPFSMNMGGKKSLAYKILKVLANPRYDCTDLKKGRNIIIEREGTGMATVYSAPTIAEDKTEVPEKIIKQMKTFEEMIPMYDEDRQKTAYFGKNASDDSSSSAASSSKKSSSAASSSTASSDEDDKKSSAASSDAGSSSAGSSSTASSSAASSDADEKPKKGKKGKKASSSAADSDDKDSSSAASSSAASSSAAESSAASDEDDKPAKGKKGKPGPKKGAKKGKAKKGKK